MSVAISLNGPGPTPETKEITTSQAPRNDIFLFCHCERSDAISLNGPASITISWQ